MLHRSDKLGPGTFSSVFIYGRLKRYHQLEEISEAHQILFILAIFLRVELTCANLDLKVSVRNAVYRALK